MTPRTCTVCGTQKTLNWYHVKTPEMKCQKCYARLRWRNKERPKAKKKARVYQFGGEL